MDEACSAEISLIIVFTLEYYTKDIVVVNRRYGFASVPPCTCSYLQSARRNNSNTRRKLL